MKYDKIKYFYIFVELENKETAFTQECVISLTTKFKLRLAHDINNVFKLILSNCFWIPYCFHFILEQLS